MTVDPWAAVVFYWAQPPASRAVCNGVASKTGRHVEHWDCSLSYVCFYFSVCLVGCVFCLVVSSFMKIGGKQSCWSSPSELLKTGVQNANCQISCSVLRMKWCDFEVKCCQTIISSVQALAYFVDQIARNRKLLAHSLAEKPFLYHLYIDVLHTNRKRIFRIQLSCYSKNNLAVSKCNFAVAHVTHALFKVTRWGHSRLQTIPGVTGFKTEMVTRCHDVVDQDCRLMDNLTLTHLTLLSAALTLLGPSREEKRRVCVRWLPRHGLAVRWDEQRAVRVHLPGQCWDDSRRQKTFRIAVWDVRQSKVVESHWAQTLIKQIISIRSKRSECRLCECWLLFGKIIH